MADITISLQQVVDFLRHLFVPSFCCYCSIVLDDQRTFCDDCYALVQPVVSLQLEITTSYEVSVFAAAAYQGPMQKLVLAKRWSHRYASRQLGKLVWERTPISIIPADVIVPIPLHWTRYARRGYNQAQEMAYVLSSYKKIPVVPLVKRVVATRYQTELAKSAREDNVKAAFALDSRYAGAYKNKHIVVVDDVLTTGATMRAVVKALMPLKPAKITVIVGARGV